MNNPIHFIVARSREGWAVNVDSDTLSEHTGPETALEEAHRLADGSRRDGCEVSVADLSKDPPPG